MVDGSMLDAVKKLTRQVESIEQILPRLATKDDLKAFATKEDLKATRDELRAEIAEARRHATMLNEDLRDDIRIVLEHLVALSNRVEALSRR